MKLTKISILVPVYKVEQYLQRCIDSVLSQDFKGWEMILVDDGSPDNCPQICDGAAEKDSRISVIHKENGGHLSARLAGFKKAKGEYLIFIDSDDWLLPNALKILYDAITSESGYDVVRSMVLRVSGKKKWLEHYAIEDGCFESDGFYLAACEDNSIAPYLHSAIYKADLFKAEYFELIIQNNIVLGEDWLMNCIIASRVNKVKFIETPTYAYFINTSSIMGGSIYGWDYYKRVDYCLRQIKALLNLKEDIRDKNQTAFMNMQFFFTPEIPFSWEEFRVIQPVILKCLNSGANYNYNPRYVRFIGHPYLFYLYSCLYRFAFWLVKLKGRKRKILS